MGGLKPAIKSMVRAFRAQTLDMAIEQARYQEEHLHSLRLPSDRPYRSNFSTSKPLLRTHPPNLRIPQGYQAKPSPNNLVAPKFPGNNNHRPTRFIPAAERAEKIAKGLCFLCDQPFERGHKCSSLTKQLFLVGVLGDEEETGEEGIFTGEVNFVEEEVEPQISINAMSGHPGFNTMRVNGHKGKKTLHILIDSGSTHNFLHEHLARKMGCLLEPITAQTVAIADGNTLQCKFICRQFTWTLHGVKFVSDILLLPLGGCDLDMGFK